MSKLHSSAFSLQPLAFLFLALAGFWVAPSAWAQASPNPPDRLAYQGYLVDANGVALATNAPKNYDVIFRIWNDSSATAAGNRLWTEQQTVTVDKGYFSVILGEGSSIGEARPVLSTIFTNATASDRWVAITVKGIGPGSTDVNILPRLRLLTSPYAFLAANAINATKTAKLVTASGADLITSSGTNVTISGTLSATTLSATTMTGNGSGLTALSGANITDGSIANSKLATIDTAGKVADSALSANVALLNRDPQNFSGTIGYSGKVGIGSTNPLAKLEIQSGADANGANDQKALALAWSGGGYRHFIRSRHNASANDTGNAIDFFINSTNTPGGSTAPGTGNTQVMTLAGNGNVGIGTSSPSNKLSVAGSANFSGNVGIGAASAASRLVLQGDAPANVVQLVIQGNTNPNEQLLIGFNTTDNYGIIQPIEQNIGFRNLCLNPSGANVGIGTTNPSQAKLQIAGSPNRTGSGLTTYWAQQGVTTWTGGVDPGGITSIYADGRIVGLGFVSHSDERIKRVIGHSDAARDLGTLMGIEVTDYSFVDTVAKGTGRHKKVIAQQVEKVFPQAVSKSTEVVADIYEKAAVKDGWIKLATNLKKGERVRLLSKTQEGIYEVLEVAEGKFRTGFPADGDQVLVYGREVKDFRSVDYEAIAMLNVSATQELARKLAAQEAELTELRAEVAKLRSEKKTLAQSVPDREQVWEARLARLELALQEASSKTKAQAREQTREHARELGSLNQ